MVCCPAVPLPTNSPPPPLQGRSMPSKLSCLGDICILIAFIALWNHFLLALLYPHWENRVSIRITTSPNRDSLVHIDPVSIPLSIRKHILVLGKICQDNFDHKLDFQSIYWLTALDTETSLATTLTTRFQQCQQLYTLHYLYKHHHRVVFLFLHLGLIS